MLPAVCPQGLQLPECPWGRRWVYLWAAVLASTTLAECIQERTASGSSFILAVAPRGRLSWIPNIFEAPKVLLAPLHHQEDKTTEGGTTSRKVQEEKEEFYRMKEESKIWFVFSGIEMSESSRTNKGQRKEGNKRRIRRRRRRRKRRTGEIRRKRKAGRSVQEEVTPQFRSAAQLLICFWLNLTFHSGRTKMIKS